jgi:cysteine synthase
MTALHSTIAQSVLDLYRPALVPLEVNLSALVFPLMKIYPAECALRRASASGEIDDQTLIVESSSGTMALALAVVCNLQGRRLSIVSDYACDRDLCKRIEDLGAKIEIVQGPAACGGYQRSRLDRLNQIREQEPHSWWVNQYNNPANPMAYEAVAEYLVKTHGRVDSVVGSVGSGGSMCGLAKCLRSSYAGLHVIGVDTFGSVLFGLEDAPRTLRGLGNSILPGNLDHTDFDEIHWVTAAEAYTATRLLHRATALFRGGTSGASWLVARYWARKNPGHRVVCIFPDDGYRYLQTIYDNTYMHSQHLWREQLPLEAECVRLPEARNSWTYIDWARRHYSEVISSQPAFSAQ